MVNLGPAPTDHLASELLFSLRRENIRNAKKYWLEIENQIIGVYVDRKEGVGEKSWRQLDKFLELELSTAGCFLGAFVDECVSEYRPNYMKEAGLDFIPVESETRIFDSQFLRAAGISTDVEVKFFKMNYLDLCSKSISAALLVKKLGNFYFEKAKRVSIHHCCFELGLEGGGHLPRFIDAKTRDNLVSRHYDFITERVIRRTFDICEESGLRNIESITALLQVLIVVETLNFKLSRFEKKKLTVVEIAFTRDEKQLITASELANIHESSIAIIVR